MSSTANSSAYQLAFTVTMVQLHDIRSWRMLVCRCDIVSAACSAEAAAAQEAAQRREARAEAAELAVRAREDAATRAVALLGAEREALKVCCSCHHLGQAECAPHAGQHACQGWQSGFG